MMFRGKAHHMPLRLLWVLSLFTLTSCTLLPPPQLEQGHSGRLSANHEIQNIPFFPQVSDQCGPASLATVLAYRGAEVSSESLRDDVYLPGKEGSLQIELVARARREGFLVYPLNHSLTDLLLEVQAGNPVLVLQNLRFDSWPQWHYAVVIGYNVPDRTVTLRSGQARRYVVDMALFEQTWRRAGRWGIVVTEPAQLPVTAEQAPLLSAVHDLELLGNQSAATAGYKAALGQWPNSYSALFGLGNMAYRAGNLAESVAYFYRLALTSPAFFPGWNNLAYALDSAGCKAEALAAAQCAVGVSLDQQKAAAMDTLTDIRRSDAVPKAIDHCPSIQCLFPGY